MLWFVLATLALLVVLLTALESDLRQLLLARRGLYSLEHLEERTGLSERALSRRLGPSRADGLYEVSPAALASLPRQRRRDPWHPVLGAATALVLLGGLVLAWRTGSASWTPLFLGAAYTLTCLTVTVAALWRGGVLGRDRSQPSPEDQAEQAAAAAWMRLAERDDVPLADQCTRTVAACDHLAAGVGRWTDRVWGDRSIPLLPRLIAGSYASYQAWQARDAVREAEEMQAEVRQMRAELEDELRRIDEELDQL